VNKATLNNDQFRILVLEDDLISQASVSQAVRRAAPEGILLMARSLAEGRRLLEKYEFQFCVLDIQLPDGSGIDFLHEVQFSSPQATVAILTGVPLPHYRDQAEAFGVLHFMEKPADAKLLGALVRERHEQCRVPHADSDMGFSAALTQLTTLDIIQLKCLARSSAALDFIGHHGRHGRICFKDGEILHAETDTQQGVDAFNEIVGWRGGQVLEVPDAPQPTRTVEGHWQGLLMHAVQWVDENKQP
jgi:DNA-binding NarL/FixJ family response regulator